MATVKAKASKGYLNNPNLKQIGETIQFTQEMVFEYAKCAEDPIYFIQTYVKVITLDHGVQPFRLFPYQIKFIKSLHENRRNVGMFPRQHGKTVCVAAYILHYLLFNDTKTAAILANKASAAREIMSRLQLMFESLPKFLQQGVKEWNKGSIMLENGSGAFTAATSASGIRGKSCVTADTKICIESSGDVYYRPIVYQTKSNIDALYEYKTVNLLTGDIFYGKHSSNITTDGEFDDGFIGNGDSFIDAIKKYGPESFKTSIISRIVSDNNVQTSQNVLKILSQHDFREFDEIIEQPFPRRLLKLEFDNGNSIKCTPDHRFMLYDGSWINADSIHIGQILKYDIIVTGVTDVEPEPVYDVINVEGTHSYYTNGVESHNCNLLYVDEAAIIPPNVAEEFFTSTYPVISSGETTKVILTSTPLGMNHFYKYWTEAVNGINGFTPIRCDWWEHPKHDQKWADEQLQLLGSKVKFNQEIECSFVGSAFSLIDGKKISELPMLKGNQLFPDYIEYFPPDKSKSYVITVDTSRGSELDYSAFPIIDISTMPYKVVAVYRNNAISSLVYPEVIYRAGKRYNDAFVLIESNDLGQQVADILFYDLEYENVYMSVKDKVKEGGGSKKSPGLRTTKRTKSIGCSQLKDLIENDQLEVNDPEIISELSTFIRKGASYAADEGKHDDLAMCLVMFGYLVQEPIFKDLFDFSLRDMMIKNQLKELDDILDPIGFFDRGDDFMITSSSNYNPNGWIENTTDEWNF